MKKKLLYKDNGGLEVYIDDTANKPIYIEDAENRPMVVFYQDGLFQYFMYLGTFKNIVKMFLQGYLSKEEKESEE